MNLQQLLSSETLQYFIDLYGKLGPWTGILLTFIEAFLPILPLTAFIMGNAAAFGLLYGFILSSVGSIAGAWTVYWIFRYFGQTSFIKKYKDRPGIQKYTAWMENKGFLMIMLLCMIPVFPNSVVTIVSGIRKISFKIFSIASALGIMGLTFILSFIGHDIIDIMTNPLKIISVIATFVSISVLGRIIERRVIVNS